jgi:hypothetical protein
MYVNILTTLQIGRKNLHYITAMKFLMFTWSKCMNFWNGLVGLCFSKNWSRPDCRTLLKNSFHVKRCSKSFHISALSKPSAYSHFFLPYEIIIYYCYKNFFSGTISYRITRGSVVQSRPNPYRKRYAYLQTRPDRPWCPPSLHFNEYQFFSEVNRPERNANHLLPSVAEFEVEWSYIPTFVSVQKLLLNCTRTCSDPHVMVL